MNIYKVFLIALVSCLSFAAYADDLKKGETLYVQQCASCHGAKGEGLGIFPSLSGKTYQETLNLLNTYRSYGKVGRLSALMYVRVSNLSDQETEQLSIYIETLK